MSNQRFLIHPKLDWLFLGGFSLVCSGMFFLLGTSSSGLVPYALMVLLLFSYPHFIASLVVFYSRREIFREHPFIALWIPLGMLVLFVGISAKGSTQALMLCGQVAVLFLYWHFLKQAYGVSLWMGSTARPVAAFKKKLLLLGCLLVGAYGYMGSQGSAGVMRVFRIPISRFQVRPWAITLFGTLGYIVLGLFFAASAWDFYKRREQADFHPRGWIPLFALITWFDPHFADSPVVFLVPIFHALQYLPFPIRAQINAFAKRGGEGLGQVFLYLLALVLGGALAFELLPRGGVALFSSVPSFFIFGCVSMFLNLHHYFIDSVIWRFRNPTVLKRLVPAEAAPAV